MHTFTQFYGGAEKVRTEKTELAKAQRIADIDHETRTTTEFVEFIQCPQFIYFI